MFSLEQLRCFVAVADEQHFGRAAARLLMTQPSLSRQVQRLEASVGASLILRDSRSVSLTPAGLAFEGEARRILTLVGEASRVAVSAAAGHAGRLSIGFTATSAVPVLSALLGQADELLPDAQVHLEELVTEAQLRRLRDGALDLGLVRLTRRAPDVTSRLVHRERLLLALRADHPLAAEDRLVSPDELAGNDLVMYSRKSARYLFDLCAAVLANVPVRETQYVTQVHTMLALVSAGRGVAIVPESAAATAPAGVEFRRLAGWEERVVHLHAAWLSSATNPVLHRALQTMPGLQPIE